jgi:cell division septal protein FtsQ
MKMKRKSNYRMHAARAESPAAGTLRLSVLKAAADLGMAVLAAGLLVGFFFLSRVILERVRGSESFRLHTVLVEGNARFSSDEIMKMGGIEKGMSIFDIDAGSIEAMIERQPWIKQAEATRVWPDAVSIAVREREVAATVLVDGALYRIDRDGEIFERHPEDAPVDTVLVTGLDEDLVAESRELVEEELRRILQFVDRYDKLGLNLGKSAIGEVHRENGGGLVVYTKTEAREIRFGSGHYLRKIKNLRNLLFHLAKHKREWDYIMLDSEAFPNRMVVKLK